MSQLEQLQSQPQLLTSWLPCLDDNEADDSGHNARAVHGVGVISGHGDGTISGHGDGAISGHGDGAITASPYELVSLTTAATNEIPGQDMDKSFVSESR